MKEKLEIEIINILNSKSELSSKEIHETLLLPISYATVKRNLNQLINNNIVETIGKGKSTKYILSKCYELQLPIDLDKYYSKEIDEREIKDSFNLSLINSLNECKLFNDNEIEFLDILQNKYKCNIFELSEFEYNKEIERLSIDLSWKSSQIEGNTYSLLETEILLKDRITASGKTKEEAIMLLNHKDAINYIVDNPKFVIPINVAKIEFIHSILIKELQIEKNIRRRRVGITGTNYKPLDNQFQINEALINMCELIESRSNIFEKAFIALILISYIQPFSDGNKRTARIISNAILMNYGYCPMSFRTVDSIDYKKAMLLFYEQNNITHFKNIFISQYEFAVNNYF